ncbi:MAG: hypothetical protein ACR2GG_12175 [Gemmatimonadaceae bacterium]
MVRPVRLAALAVTMSGAFFSGASAQSIDLMARVQRFLTQSIPSGFLTTRPRLA